MAVTLNLTTVNAGTYQYAALGQRPFTHPTTVDLLDGYTVEQIVKASSELQVDLDAGDITLSFNGTTVSDIDDELFLTPLIIFNNHEASVGEHTDVDITTSAPSNNDVLKWNSSNSEFEPGDLTALPLGSVDEHSDVDTSTVAPNPGDSMVFDGSNWVPSGASAVSSNNYLFSYDTTTQSAGATRAFGTVTLDSGASGSVDGITVDGVQVMFGAESFDTDLATTAANVAANIAAATSSPNYTASSSGAVVTIRSLTSGTGPNGFVVASSTTTIVTTDVNMSGGTAASTNTFVPIYFSTNGQIDGWAHSEGTSVFTCNQDSQYAATVEFNVEKSGSGSPEVEIRSTLDGTEIPGSHNGMDITSNNTAFSISRTFLFNADAGEDFVVEIATDKTTVSIVPAPSPAGADTPISATLTIRRLT
jgi:hypothetical protein